MLLFLKPSRLARVLCSGSVLIAAVCILGAGAGTFAIDFYRTWQMELGKSAYAPKSSMSPAEMKMRVRKQPFTVYAEAMRKSSSGQEQKLLVERWRRTSRCGASSMDTRSGCLIFAATGPSC